MPEIGTSGSMSGDGKRSVAEWPKLPRPSSTLPEGICSAASSSHLPAARRWYGLLRSAIFDRHNSELAPAPKVNLNGPTEKPSVDFFGLVRQPLAYPEDRPRLLAAVEVYRGVRRYERAFWASRDKIGRATAGESSTAMRAWALPAESRPEWRSSLRSSIGGDGSQSAAPRSLGCFLSIDGIDESQRLF